MGITAWNVISIGLTGNDVGVGAVPFDRPLNEGELVGC